MSQLATRSVHRDNSSMLIWVLLLILGGVLFFFSLDRQIVSILKTTLMHELSLSNTDYSILISAFMIPYTFMYFIVGGIVDRFGSRYVLSVLMVVMSIATLITGMSTSLNGLIAGRVLLGLAEAGIVPALTLAIFTWFKAEKRAFAFQLTNIIQSLGLILAPPFVAWVTLSTGWRWAFFIPAIAGVAVGLMWFFSSRRTPPAVEEAACENAASVPLLQRYKMVLTSKPIWALLIARLLTDPFWFFYQYWQVGFMQEKIGLTLAQVGKMMWFPPLVAVFGVLVACWMSDKLVARGMSSTRARLTVIWSVTCLSPLVFLLPSMSNPYAAVAIMTVINFMCTAWLSMATIMMGGLAPRIAIATAIGVMSALGGVSSIIFNGFVGTIIDHFGYSLPVYIGATLHPIGAIVLAVYFLRNKQHLSPQESL
ncbi:MAG TPA: MFS transporter [Buttiauxella sp.]|uniref:MFS transporter n=1 Tax=Buttiauxella sp. TaxID=1972222 RepID=UPI002B47A1EE|nr:MFS transporter [Buttiauxella sp.]HKM97669.1 MFS transporter [Buttiauxella sp.]